MDTQMWVITHKNYPGISDDLYRTLHVGRALSQDLGYTGDDTGDNISLKNRNSIHTISIRILFTFFFNQICNFSCSFFNYFYIFTFNHNSN